MNRKQISVGLNDQELQLLDELRDTIPRGVFMRNLLLERRPKMNIKERIIRLKKAYLKKWGQSPTKVLLTPRCEIELESLKNTDLGDIVGQITVKGARVLKEIVGLKTQWDWKEEKGLAVQGNQGGPLCEHDI